ncbi:MAG: ATP-binding protein [Nanoarchaeota archaeon]
MNVEILKEAIINSNKWWKEPISLDFRHRDIYDEIKKYYSKKQIVALVGLRRTGKTTIMLKIIQDAIKSMPSESIMYFSFDEYRGIRIQEVINIYLNLLNKKISSEKYLFLFDEIQKVDNWEEQLKRIYDGNQNIKFIISGSESLFIRKKSRESLAGRMYEFQIKNLNFREYLKFKNIEFNNLEIYKNEILSEFNKYLISNGFPELINEDKESSSKYIKENVIERIIYKDIPQITNINDPSTLDQIYKIILYNPGNIINIIDLSKDLGISRQTISNYLDYLEKSFLINKLYNYSKNVKKTQRKFKRYYPSIIIPELLEKEDFFGKVFETSIVNQIGAQFFWRDNNKNEVDIIQPEPLTAIEIKSGEIKERDLVPLIKFSKKFNPNSAIIISYNLKKTIKLIEIIPFYEYLLKSKM